MDQTGWIDNNACYEDSSTTGTCASCSDDCTRPCITSNTEIKSDAERSIDEQDRIMLEEEKRRGSLCGSLFFCIIGNKYLLYSRKY